ncbi:14464_t:CDS:2 [Ambispora leptoticha]|uniref:14464_t:CDS:1 n=1 Tax=Ambispora leptoticha TaxID=144679 RepID=A0A9N9G3U3_9GLOM|nr:14464_t:CDS:2 [Ambispora leptoticha]
MLLPTDISPPEEMDERQFLMMLRTSSEDFTNSAILILRALPSVIHIPDKRLTKIRKELQYWAPQVQDVYREYSQLKNYRIEKKVLTIS